MGSQAKSIVELRNQVLDYARPNQFDVNFLNVPSVVQSGFDRLNPASLIKGCTVPSTVAGLIPLHFLGRKWDYPGDMTQGELVLIFRVDIAYEVYQQFKTWQKLIVDFSDGSDKAFGNPRIAKDGTIKVTQLSHLDGNSPVYDWIFYAAWPSTISEITHAMEDDTTIEEFTVTFTYGYLDVEKKDYSPSSGSQGLVASLLDKLL